MAPRYLQPHRKQGNRFIQFPLLEKMIFLTTLLTWFLFFLARFPTCWLVPPLLVSCSHQTALPFQRIVWNSLRTTTLQVKSGGFGKHNYLILKIVWSFKGILCWSRFRKFWKYSVNLDLSCVLRRPAWELLHRQQRNMRAVCFAYSLIHRRSLWSKGNARMDYRCQLF